MRHPVDSAAVRLLVVEDSPADHALLLAHLRRSTLADAELAHATTLADAEALLASFRPDCVLLDLGLPDADGHQALAAMVASAHSAPVVVLTGDGDPAHALDAVAAGAQDYLVKGTFDAASLERTVRYSVERARATTELRRLEAELTREHRRLVQAQRIARLGGWTLDTSTEMIDLTAEAAEIVGLTPGPISVNGLMDVTHPDDHERSRELVEAARAGRSASGVLRMDPASGERWVQIRVEPSDDVATAVGTVQDVTERETAALDREHLVRLLQHAQRLESLGRLAGGIAHNFNNLLAAMRMQADLARFDATPGSEAEERLADVLDTIERASRLTRELLVFGRRSADDVEVFDMDELVRATRAMLDQVLGDHIVLRLDLAGPPAVVRANRHQIEQAIVNLAINARDAMPAGGTLTLSTRHGDDGRLALIVGDDGDGMTADVRDRATEPFFTTKPPEHGTGLGLSIVHGAVTQAGGELTIESEVGVGTTVTIVLATTDEPVPAPDTSPEVAGSTERAAVVMVVDDQPDLVTLAEALLRRRGYTVFGMSSATAACERAASLEHVDVLLTDLVMPDMGGGELAGRLRRAFDDLKVVYMSGYADGQLGDDPLPADSEFLAKPFAAAQLYAVIDRVLGSGGLPDGHVRD